MGVTTGQRETVLPPGPGQDLALDAVTDALQDKGFVVANLDKLVNWGAYRVAVADDLRSGLLRCRNDACLYAAL